MHSRRCPPASAPRPLEYLAHYPGIGIHPTAPATEEGTQTCKRIVAVCSLAFLCLNARRLATLQEADFIARSIMEEYGQTDNVWQFPVVLIPVSFGPVGSIGSIGSTDSTDSTDPRDSRDSIVLRPVNSEDGMTANFARLPIEVLQHIADEITARLSDVDAVFLDVTHKPPATIEWECRFRYRLETDWKLRAYLAIPEPHAPCPAR